MTDLLSALDELVPEPRGTGDWNDVLSRAHGGRRATPRRLALGVAVAMLAIVVATPAFGVGSALLDLIGRTTVDFSHASPASNVVKKTFYDLMGPGRPAGMSPEAIAVETRQVGRYRIHGRLRTLWVAPTEGGGYCFMYEHAFGGCAATSSSRRTLTVGYMTGALTTIAAVNGTVGSTHVARIQIEYRDGRRSTVPFVWVSAPIAAGFFAFDVPHGRTVARIVALTASGKRVATSAPPTGRPRGSRPFALRPQQLPLRRPGKNVLPSAPKIPLTAPIQRGSADGVSVRVGRNGSAVFDTAGAKARLAGLGSTFSYSCFRLGRVFGLFDMSGVGQQGVLRPHVAVDIGSRGPFDGCEIEGTYGRVWPDRFRSHDPVEIALTAAGRRYFADRAAARDLAAFVRSKRVQTIRKEPPEQARRDLDAAFPQLARSAIRIAAGSRLTFSERSTSGRKFSVTVANGRVVHENLRPYAFVF